MSVRTKAQTTAEWAEIRVTVPVAQASTAKKAIAGMFALAGVTAQVKDGVDSDDLTLATEVFPESTPGKLLRGLRTRENLTQAQLAEALGIHAHHVSDMERGVRNISTAMAKKIERLYKVPRQIFM